MRFNFDARSPCRLVAVLLHLPSIFTLLGGCTMSRSRVRSLLVRLAPVALMALIVLSFGASGVGAQGPVPTPGPLPDVTGLIIAPMNEMRNQAFILVGAAIVIAMSFFALRFGWGKARSFIGR